MFNLHVTLADILFASRSWLFPAIAFIIVALALIVHAYRRAPVDGSVRATAGVLKAMGIVILALFLIEPLWSGQRVKPGANRFIVLADNSQSLRVTDAGGDAPRGQRMREALAEEPGGWLGRLAEDFDIRRYSFDSSLHAQQAFDALAFDGRSSDLLTALRELAARMKDKHLAGVLVFTDGNATDVPQGALDLPAFPVYPVVVGDDRDLRDLGVESVAATRTAFEDAPVSVRAEVSHHGYAGREITCQLLDESGAVVQTQTVTAPRHDAPLGFTFDIKPTGKRVAFYQVRVAAADEVAALAAGQTIDEATADNNARQVLVDRGGGPYRILYMSGRPNWEYKFIRRALVDDDQTRLTGLIRIAKRQPKFVFRARDEQVNPLFAGSDQRGEDTERFDEPVFVRLDVEDPDELRKGFPQTREALYKFDAVIIDDLEAAAFSGDQMAMLEKFVSDRGGGLLMLGGTESFENGGYAHTPVARMLPVYLDRAGNAPATRVRLDVTREGLLQPWVRLRGTEQAERQRLADMPGFVVLNRVRGIKPGASILANVQDDTGGSWPALVMQRYGRGRVGAMMIGDLWRWALLQGGDETRDPPLPADQRDQAKAWRQVARWLVADVPQRIEVEVKPMHDRPGAALDVHVRVRDEQFAPRDNVQATVRVTPPGGETVELEAQMSLDEAGLYQTAYLPRQAGAYRAAVVVRDEAGAELGRVDTGWTADPAAEEFKSVRPNVALLREIASRTGGRVIRMNELAGVVNDLQYEPAPVMERAVTPLWHQWWMLALAVACLVGEWGLRRWKGLP